MEKCVGSICGLPEHLEQLPTLKDFQLDGYNQEEEEDYLTNNQDREMIACLGSELENLQPLLVDQDEYYMGECNGGLGAENDVMWDGNVIDVWCNFSSDEDGYGLYDGQAKNSD
ncbi:hypothetical protein L218DRAFT_1005789 [Marasmius fiardii PR-910]|nr:hypothetical protein L218DRAFT_1005789 [Marasmius fiardii PR-910]